LLRLIEVTGPEFAGKKKATEKPKDETRSGRAMSLAVRTVVRGKGKMTFLALLYDDPDGADWANEDRPRNEDRAWERAVEKFGGWVSGSAATKARRSTISTTCRLH